MKIDSKLAEKIAFYIENGHSIGNGKVYSLSFFYEKGIFIKVCEDRRENESFTSSYSRAEFISEIQNYDVSEFYKLKEDVEQFVKNREMFPVNKNNSGNEIKNTTPSKPASSESNSEEIAKNIALKIKSVPYLFEDLEISFLSHKGYVFKKYVTTDALESQVKYIPENEIVKFILNLGLPSFSEYIKNYI